MTSKSKGKVQGKRALIEADEADEVQENDDFMEL